MKIMEDKFSLEGKHVLICGASGGIGNAIARLAAKSGATLFLTGRNEEKLKMLMQSIHGKDHGFFSADLIKSSERQALIEHLPQIDGVVYAAGSTAHMPASFINEGHLEQLMKINFESAVLLLSGLLTGKKIVQNGSLVFISSVASRLPYFGGAIYSASKAALESYVKTLALELAPKKIRSNALSPTFVQTEMVEKTEKIISSESLEKLRKIHPLGFGTPEDVAHAAVFFLSDASSWITGENISMGGI